MVPAPLGDDEVVVVKTVAEPRPLLVWVPMPKKTVPVMLGCPVGGAARLMMVPLLSTLMAATGLGSCWNGAAVDAARAMIVEQPADGQS